MAVSSSASLKFYLVKSMFEVVSGQFNGVSGFVVCALIAEA